MPTPKRTPKSKSSQTARKSSRTDKPGPATKKSKKTTTPTYMKIFYGLMLLVLLMGSFARIARGTRPAASVQATATPARLTVPTSFPAADDPNQVVRAFLTAVENDPASQEGLSYLSLELLDEVKSGQQLPDLLGVETTFPSFEIQEIDNGQTTGAATIRATLALDPPVVVTFDLSKETGTWQINHIQH